MSSSPARGEPYITQVVTQPEPNANTRSLALVGSHDLPFETFWDAYPRQVEKPKTRQAWTRAIRRAPDHVIIDGARRFAHDPNRQDCYTPYPAKWLDGDCWNDPPIPNRNPAPKEPRGFAGIRAGLEARGLA